MAKNPYADLADYYQINGHRIAVIQHTGNFDHDGWSTNFTLRTPIIPSVIIDGEVVINWRQASRSWTFCGTLESRTPLLSEEDFYYETVYHGLLTPGLTEADFLSKWRNDRATGYWCLSACRLFWATAYGEPPESQKRLAIDYLSLEIENPAACSVRLANEIINR